MADTSTDGQAALGELARAHRALLEEGPVSVSGLLSAWRRLRPVAHPGAHLDQIDVTYLARMRAQHGEALLRCPHLVVHPAHPRAAPRAVRFDDSAGVAHIEAPTHASQRGVVLAWALGLSLEAAKLAHALPARPDALREAFSTPAEARAALEAVVRGGHTREVQIHAAPRGGADAARLESLLGDRPVHVLAGHGAFRVHDLLSPWARRLRDKLTPLGRALGAPQDEESYAAAAIVLQDEAVHVERLTAEEDDGFAAAGPGVVVVRCERLSDGAADQRCRDACQQLRRARNPLVLVEPDATTLESVLAVVGTRCRTVTVLEEGSATITPTYAEDPASRHVLHLDNALGGAGLLVTLPARSFMPTHTAHAHDASTFPLVTAVTRAQAHGHIAPTTRVAVRTAPWEDLRAMSRACIDLVSRLESSPGRPRR